MDYKFCAGGCTNRLDARLRAGIDAGMADAPKSHMRSTSGAGLFATMSLVSLSARAEESTRKTVLGNIDAQFGAGAGMIGIAFHTGMSLQASFGELYIDG
jgi:hypothetical protein